MKRMTLLALMTISVMACERQSFQSKIFSDYLRRRFDKEMPMEKHTYVTFPKSVGCMGCSVHTLDYLIVNRFKDVTLICNEDQLNSMPPDLGYEVLVDSTGEIERLNLQTQNVAILVSTEHKLQEIISIQPNSIDSVLESYFSKQKGSF